MITRIRQELAILLRTAADKIAPPVPTGEWLDISLYATSSGRLKPSAGAQVRWSQHPSTQTKILGVEQDHGWVGGDAEPPSYDDAVTSRVYDEYPLSHHLPPEEKNTES